MLNKSADSLPQKDAQAFKQLAVFHCLSLEIPRFQKLQKRLEACGKIIVNSP